MSFRFLNRLNSTKRITGFSTATARIDITASPGASTYQPGDGRLHYVWQPSSPTTSSGPHTLTFSTTTTINSSTSTYIQKSREIKSSSPVQPIIIEAHGGPSGSSGGISTVIFSSPGVSGKTYSVNFGGGASPGPAGHYAGVFFPSTVSQANSIVIGGGSGNPSGAGQPGAAGGGLSGNSSPGSSGGGGPGQASGAGGGTQANGGSGASTGPGYGPGSPGSALTGGGGGGGDTYPGGGGGGGYFGGGGGAGGYRGDNFNSGSGGGGGSGYVTPTAISSSTTVGISTGLKVIVKV